MKSFRILAVWSCALAANFALSGCTDSGDALIAEQRDRIMLTTEPENAVSVSAAKTAAKDGDQVVVFGAIDLSESAIAGGDAALFVLREVTLDAHGDAQSHNPSDCPFCKHEFANAPQVTVVVKGEDGKPLPFAPQDLLQVEQGQVVVVQGTADRNPELDLFTIEVSGVYKRK